MIPGETVLTNPEVAQDPHTGPFKVLRSGGGYYVGTMVVSCGEANCDTCGWAGFKKGAETEPNSRETDYFKTQKEAEAALKSLVGDNGNIDGELPGLR